jgi:hypothetical protein
VPRESCKTTGGVGRGFGLEILGLSNVEKKGREGKREKGKGQRAWVRRSEIWECGEKRDSLTTVL